MVRMREAAIVTRAGRRTRRRRALGLIRIAYDLLLRTAVGVVAITELRAKLVGVREVQRGLRLEVRNLLRQVRLDIHYGGQPPGWDGACVVAMERVPTIKVFLSFD